MENTSKNWSPNSDSLLWFSIFALVASGLVMVYSSSFIFAEEKYHDGMYFFKRHLFFSVIGIATFFLGKKIKLAHLKKYAFFILLAAFIGLGATFIPGLAKKAGGATRWIELFGVSIQPAEFAKLAVIFFVSSQIAKKIHLQDNFRSGFLTYFILVLPLYVILLKQPDFGSFALIITTTIFMLYGCGVKTRYIGSTLLGALISFTILIFSSHYRLERVKGFLDPWSDPGKKGFQIIQSLLAFFSGKWLGVGLGNSQEKLFYLPEAHNDFIFAVVGEELGLLGVFFFVGLFLIVVLRGLTISQKLNDQFEKAVAIGITSMIGIQAFFNMAVVLGLLPTKGLPLPLISYGGSSLIVTLFLLGVLVQLSEKTA